MLFDVNMMDKYDTNYKEVNIQSDTSNGHSN